MTEKDPSAPTDRDPSDLAHADTEGTPAGLTATDPVRGDAATVDAQRGPVGPGSDDTTLPGRDRGDRGPHVFRVVDRSEYGVGGEMARGGMGRILHAHDHRHGRPVAIKELLGASSAHHARFRREALITARLQHPAIVPVYEAGRWPSGEPFFAMKKVEGKSLDRAIAERATLKERLGLLPNVIAVADALAYAHEQRIIHRDLKPANVLVGDFGETVVIDWGLAKDLAATETAATISEDGTPGSSARPHCDLLTLSVGDEELPGEVPPSSEDGLTVAGRAMGTPAYMPPEQARGEVVDERADVYALGAILYHLLSGQIPYADTTTSDVLARVKAEPPTPLAVFEPKAPPDLAAIVSRAMARDAGDRYPTAKQLAQDLRRFETGQLVSVHDYSMTELLGRWLHRYRAVVAMVGLLVVSLAVGGSLAVSRVIRERDRAESHSRAAAAARQAEEQRRLEAERAHREAVEAHEQAVTAQKEAQNAAEMLVDAWVQSQFAGGIRDCCRRARGARVAGLDALLRLEVDAQGAVDRVEPVHQFGTAADQCILERSRRWRFPPGTPVGVYDLVLAVDPESHEVQVGFLFADADSIRRTVERRYQVGVRQCYQELLRSQPAATGTVATHITVGERGQISIDRIDAFAPEMRRCVTDFIRRWRLPPPRAGDGTTTAVAFESQDRFTPPRVPEKKPAATTRPREEEDAEVEISPECIANPLDPSCTEGSASTPTWSEDDHRVAELDQSDIRRYVRRRLKAIRYCYTKQLRHEPGLRGTLHTSFLIDSRGAVIEAHATGLSQPVADCVVEELKSIRFPALPGPGSTRVEDYPFSFSPTEE